MRRVTLTLEVETEAPLSVLRAAKGYTSLDSCTVVKLGNTRDWWSFAVIQAQANVVNPLKGGKKTP